MSSFPTAPVEGLIAEVNGTTYIYDSINNSWDLYYQSSVGNIVADTGNIATLEANVIYSDYYLLANGAPLVAAGATGYTGSAGTIGVDGNVGYTGSIGYTGSAGTGGSVSIDDLTDVDTTTVAPSNNQVLIWDEINSIWKPGNIGASTAGDPYFNNVSLLMKFENIGDPSDLSTAQNSISLRTNGSISNVQSKFGTYSLATSSTATNGAYTPTVTTGSPLDLYTYNPDFTMECWVYPTAYPSGTNEFSATIMAQGPVGYGAGYAPVSIAMTQAGAFNGQWNIDNTGGGNRSIASAAGQALNQWHHLALCRQGNTMYFFVNGVLINTATETDSFWDGTTGWTFGEGTNSTYRFIGYIDEVRVTKGVARYTSNFDVPTSSFPILLQSDLVYDTIASLIDVDTTTVAPLDGQALVWDNANTVWKPGNVAAESSGTTGNVVYYGYARTVDTFTGDGTTANFALSSTPADGNAVTVNYQGVVQLHDAYTINDKYIVFDPAPEANVAFEVIVDTIGSGVPTGNLEYTTRTYTGNGVATAFTVSSTTTVDNVLVTENGVVQTPTSDYTISGTTLTFTTAPAANVAIQIRELPTTAIVSGSSGTTAAVTSYSTLTNLPSSNNTEGALAFTQDTKALYIWDGAEWDRVYTGVNDTVSFDQPLLSNYVVPPAESINLMVLATDPEGFPVTYSYDTTSFNNKTANISQTGNNFSISGNIASLENSSFVFRVKATDGLNVTSTSANISVRNIFTYPAFNPSDQQGECTFSNNNTRVVGGSGTNRYGTVRSNFAITTGKWYWEIYHESGTSLGCGICDSTVTLPGFVTGARPGGAAWTLWYSTISATAGTVTNIAVDMDNQLVWFGVDGVWTGDPSAGTGGTSFTGSSATSIVYDGTSTSTNIQRCNFGQDGTFTGVVTSGNFSDYKGIGNFAYAVPTNFKSILLY